jgi:hypothetical protein
LKRLDEILEQIIQRLNEESGKGSGKENAQPLPDGPPQTLEQSAADLNEKTAEQMNAPPS